MGEDKCFRPDAHPSLPRDSFTGLILEPASKHRQVCHLQTRVSPEEPRSSVGPSVGLRDDG